ncbi:hypothetical protein D1647_22195 [Alistipes sp. Z76]|nr:hypothetical protein [Alistipes sp. Z76]NCE70859.1 hypothetical protein [Muribaculaceae bacterium M3]
MGVELIREILGSAAGSLGFVLSLLLLAGWLIYRITKYTTEWNCKLNAVKDLSENLKTAREDILYIKTKLEIFSSNMPNGLTQSHSPIGLSEKGEEIAAKMGIEQMIAANWENIRNYIEANAKSKNAYDIQQLCIESATISLDKLFNTETVDKIKEFAFNNGQPLAYYGSMIGVLIRNKYFEVKGIAVGEIDEHDPNK